MKRSARSNAKRFWAGRPKSSSHRKRTSIHDRSQRARATPARNRRRIEHQTLALHFVPAVARQRADPGSPCSLPASSGGRLPWTLRMSLTRRRDGEIVDLATNRGFWMRLARCCGDLTGFSEPGRSVSLAPALLRSPRHLTMRRGGTIHGEEEDV